MVSLGSYLNTPSRVHLNTAYALPFFLCIDPFPFLLSLVDAFPQGGRLPYLDSVRYRLDTAHVTAEKIGQVARENGLEDVLALRNFLNALDVAEKSGDLHLLRKSYGVLRRFYAVIGETDKALDYAVKQYDADRALWSISTKGPQKAMYL